MRNRVRPLLYFAPALVLAAACGSQPDEQPPVARATVTLSREKAAIGSPVSITYRFEPTDRRIEGDYWVFLHVLDQDHERMWGDDHQPPVPTSSWRAGQPVEYSRTIFVPNYPYIGPAQVRVGLYMPSTGDRLRLDAREVSQREYAVAKVEILPQSHNIFLIYKDGWHSTETHAQDPTVEWQWTKKAATLSFQNPKRDSTFYLQYDARADQFNPPQQVAVRIGDQTIHTFAADAKDARLLTIPISAAQLGDANVAELVIEVDRTFQPGGADVRDLGIRVFNAFIEPK